MSSRSDGRVVVCGALGVTADYIRHSPTDPPSAKAEAAYQQQKALRLQPKCNEEEWRGRCPHLSTMLLVGTKGGCEAAGCFALEEEVSSSAIVLSQASK